MTQKKFRYVFEGWVDTECPLDIVSPMLGVNPPIVTDINDGISTFRKTWETTGCNTVSVEEIVPPDPYLAELDKKIQAAGGDTKTGLKFARALYVKLKEHGWNMHVTS